MNRTHSPNSCPSTPSFDHDLRFGLLKVKGLSRRELAYIAVMQDDTDYNKRPLSHLTEGEGFTVWGSCTMFRSVSLTFIRFLRFLPCCLPIFG
jgi:hypothetical protein